MSQASPAEIKVPALTQVALIVKNVDEAMKNYWNILGIGPWNVLSMRAPHVHDMTYHGKPAYFELKVGLCQVGTCELELMQTIKGPTTGDDFMAKHGEGAHHLQYLVDSVDVLDKHVR